MTFRNYSAAEYRKAGINAGPFALEGNPDPAKRNYRTYRRKPILGGVMHITVGMSDYDLPDVSAEGTTRYGANTDRDASWHVCVDSDGIIPSIRDAYTAWHAGVPDIANVNDATLGMEIGTGATDWRKKPAAWVKATIRNAAVWWAPRVIKYGIPIRLENSRSAIESAIIAGRRFGFTSHKIIAPSNRTDPGWVNGVDTFPWSMFFSYLREEIALLNGTAPVPEEDDIMAMTPAERAAFAAEIAAKVWGEQITHPNPDAEVKTIAAGRALTATNYHAWRGREAATAALAILSDPTKLAAELAPLLPDGTAPSVEDLTAALRTVLGSVDDPPTPAA